MCVSTTISLFVFAMALTWAILVWHSFTKVIHSIEDQVCSSVHRIDRIARADNETREIEIGVGKKILHGVGRYCKDMPIPSIALYTGILTRIT
jgi:hypothetical protein